MCDDIERFGVALQKVMLGSRVLSCDSLGTIQIHEPLASLLRCIVAEHLRLADGRSALVSELLDLIRNFVDVGDFAGGIPNLLTVKGDASEVGSP